MAELERLTLCPLQEYKDMLPKRLTADQITSEMIMSIYFRLRHYTEAITGLVSVGSELGSLSVTLTFLDVDLKPTDLTLSGTMPDGIWNPDEDSSLSFHVGTHTHDAYNGILQPYDDGIDMDWSLEELVGAGANASMDLGSLHI